MARPGRTTKITKSPWLLLGLGLVIALSTFFWRGQHRQLAVGPDGSPAASPPVQEHIAGGDRRTKDRAMARLRTYLRGARTLVPRDQAITQRLTERLTQAAAVGSAGASDHPHAHAHAHPRQLDRGTGKLTDRRPGPPADSEQLRGQLAKRIAEAEEAAQTCLDQWAEQDDSLLSGVTLAFTLDAQGLQEVWIRDRAGVPTGPLKCIADSVYPIDWSGLTTAPAQVTVKMRYEASDGAAGDGSRS